MATGSGLSAVEPEGGRVWLCAALVPRRAPSDKPTTTATLAANRIAGVSENHQRRGHHPSLGAASCLGSRTLAMIRSAIPSGTEGQGFVLSNSDRPRRRSAALRHSGQVARWLSI